MDTNFQKIKADLDASGATTGTEMETAFNGNFDKIRLNFAEQQNQINELLYVPLEITSFTGGGRYEKGQTVTGISFAWTYNKDVTSQSIGPGSVAVASNLRSYQLTAQNITSNRTYTLSASDGKTSRTASTSVTFLDSRYWGVSDKPDLDQAAILALSSELSSSRVQSRTFNCSGGKYFYLAWPAVFGTPSFKVGGLSFSDMVKTTIELTNASGYTASYDLWRVGTIQSGAAITVDVA